MYELQRRSLRRLNTAAPRHARLIWTCLICSLLITLFLTTYSIDQMFFRDKSAIFWHTLRSKDVRASSLARRHKVRFWLCAASNKTKTRFTLLYFPEDCVHSLPWRWTKKSIIISHQLRIPMSTLSHTCIFVLELIRDTHRSV